MNINTQWHFRSSLSYHHNWQLIPFIVIQGRNPKYLHIHRFLTWFTRYDVIMRIQKEWEEEHPIYIIFAFTFFLNPTILNNFPYNTCNSAMFASILYSSPKLRWLTKNLHSFTYRTNHVMPLHIHIFIYSESRRSFIHCFSNRKWFVCAMYVPCTSLY
jgi:hypothetical protein